MKNGKTETTPPRPQLRGLYGRINISVRTLNIVILALTAALVICVIIGVSKGGFTVSFVSLGGTAVECQRHLSGELI